MSNSFFCGNDEESYSEDKQSIISFSSDNSQPQTYFANAFNSVFPSSNHGSQQELSSDEKKDENSLYFLNSYNKTTDNTISIPSKKGKNTGIKKSFKDKYPKRNRERLPKYKSLHNMRVVLKSRFFNTYM